ERRSRTVESWKTFVCVTQQPVPVSDNIAGSIKRTLELERVRNSSANKERKRRHRQPPPEQQQKPRAQQQEHDQRVEFETKASIKQTALRSANISPKACCSRRVTRRFKARRCYPSVSSVSAWG
ncbi:unnamed protein product, partial [Ectocarpus sp. 12 AP-2014]